jgi:hypothetical protein
MSDGILQRVPHRPSPLAGEGKEGGGGATSGEGSATTPLSSSPPQGGRGQVAVSDAYLVPVPEPAR